MIAALRSAMMGGMGRNQFGLRRLFWAMTTVACASWLLAYQEVAPAVVSMWIICSLLAFPIRSGAAVLSGLMIWGAFVGLMAVGGPNVFEPGAGTAPSDRALMAGLLSGTLAGAIAAEILRWLNLKRIAIPTDSERTE